ncbi:Hpt domain-containing protein [Palleronia abyssalis]|uniref:HPt domain-containing protein n=1 Tax=Palleronia abyssalis TaxID=1501240 RepID=A0A2R8BSM3_9RHOB|nr:Hpt domain-containing protein [Palleronia abyssalis]SPJ23152.1 hypothetical protein PAA8504_00957 [Palleronia abyssalis]
MISLLDMTHLAEMREIFGTEGLLELLDLFEEESSGPVDALPQQVPDQLADQLHGLRGSAENLGFSRLAVICKQSENAARDNLPVDLQSVTLAYADSCRELRSMLSGG